MEKEFDKLLKGRKPIKGLSDDYSRKTVKAGEHFHTNWYYKDTLIRVDEFHKTGEIFSVDVYHFTIANTIGVDLDSRYRIEKRKNENSGIINIRVFFKGVLVNDINFNAQKEMHGWSTEYFDSGRLRSSIEYANGKPVDGKYSIYRDRDDDHRKDHIICAEKGKMVDTIEYNACKLCAGQI